MDLKFEYDFIKDFVKPKWRESFINVFAGISLSLFGVSQILLFYNQGNKNYLTIGILILLGGLCSFLLALIGNKPLLKEGQYFLRIDNQKVYSKLGKFVTTDEVTFDEIKKIDIREREIIFGLKNGTEVRVDIKKIQNENKRTEFVNIVKDKIKQLVKN